MRDFKKVETKEGKMIRFLKVIILILFVGKVNTILVLRV